jgi:hypothetical protein
MASSSSLAHETISRIHDRVEHVPNKVVRERVWVARSILDGLLLMVGGRSAKSSAGVLKALADHGVAVGEGEDADAIASRSGFCQARDRLPAASIEMLQREVAEFVRERISERRRIFGKLGTAIDGTRLVMARDATTVGEFGLPHGGRPGGRHHYPQALLVMASEVGTRLPLAADLLPWDGSEHAGLRAILPHLGADSVVLLDRGYVGKRLLGEITATGADVILRMTISEANSWDCVYRFLKSKAKEAIATLTIPSAAGPREMRVRLIRRAFRVGRPRRGQKPETMVLLTTLLDAAIAPRDEIIALYAERWSIETAFRELKTVLNLERFHARKAHRIRQEIAAALLWMTLAAAVEHDVDQAMTKLRGRQQWNDPRRWQINRTLLLELLDDIATAIFDPDTDGIALDRMLTRAANYLVRTAQRRRPGRSNPRVRKAPHGRFRNRAG